eukprot:Sro9_g007010.2  (465) ;mRNA; r:13156-14550
MLEETRAAGGILTIPGICPHRLCRQKVTRGHIELFAPQLLNMYDGMALNSFVQGHHTTMRWCPGPGCGQIVVRARVGLFLHELGYDARFARCDACRTRYCFECGDEAHDGRRCIRLDEQALNAEEQQGERTEETTGTENDEVFGGYPRNQQNGRPRQLVAGGNRNMLRQGAGAVGMGALPPGDDNNAMEKKTNEKIRRCPSCKDPIEKNGGCNHMTCKCGTHFCWLCMTNTTGNHWNHYCGREPTRLGGDGREGLARGRRQDEIMRARRALIGRLQRMDLDYIAETVQIAQFACDSKAVKDVLQKRQELVRYAHYMNRFNAHGQGQCFAENQCECLAGRVIDFTAVSKLQNCTDADFISLSNQRLVASRRMLKYTYCFLYYKLDGDKFQEGETKADDFEDNDCPVDNAISSSLPISLALFLDHQERLERMTEQLSFLSENAVTRTDRKRVVDMVRVLKTVAIGL